MAPAAALRSFNPKAPNFQGWVQMGWWRLLLAQSPVINAIWTLAFQLTGK